VIGEMPLSHMIVVVSVADDAAGPAGVRGATIPARKPDADPPLVDVARNHSAKHGRGDIVEEARTARTPRPSNATPPANVRQHVRQMIGNVALLELVGKQLEPDQQQQQVGDDHPLMLEMEKKGSGAAAVGKAVTKAS
jgi:hypothetical protein